MCLLDSCVHCAHSAWVYFGNNGLNLSLQILHYSYKSLKHKNMTPQTDSSNFLANSLPLWVATRGHKSHKVKPDVGFVQTCVRPILFAL